MPLKLSQDDTTGPNLTPMIDVVFLLVIFFMVATKFTEREQNIDLELPQVTAAGSAATPAEPKRVAVFGDGRIELDGEPKTIESLTTTLAELTSQTSDVEVVINGDAHCEFQHIAAALAACREAKVAELGITVEIASAGGGTIKR